MWQISNCFSRALTKPTTRNTLKSKNLFGASTKTTWSLLSGSMPCGRCTEVKDRVALILIADYNPEERRGNVKLDEMFGKFAESKDAPAKPTRIGNVKTPSLPANQSGGGLLSKQKSKEHEVPAGPSREELEMRQKLEYIRDILCVTDHPVNTVNRLRELFGIPPLNHNIMDAEQVHPENHVHSQPLTQTSGNKMDIETANEAAFEGQRERGNTHINPDDLLMDEDDDAANM